MDRLLSVLARRPALGWAVTFTYVVLVFLSHDEIQRLSKWLRDTLTPALWTPLVIAALVATTVVTTLLVERRLCHSAVRSEARIAWWTSVGLAVVCAIVLFAANAEAIHFAQYAILTVLLVGLVGRLSWAALLATLIGAADEAFQYAVLHSRWRVRFDTNDVVLNAVGAALGVALVLVFASVRRRRAGEPRPSLPHVLAPLALTLALVGGGGLLAFGRGHLGLYREHAQPQTVVLLSRSKRPVTRWKTPRRQRSHYVLHPGVALLVSVGIVGALGLFDRRVSYSSPTTS